MQAQAHLPSMVRTGEAFVPREEAGAAVQSLLQRRAALRDPNLGLAPEQSTAVAACAASAFGTGLPGVPSMVAACAAAAVAGGVPIKGIPGEPKVSVELHQDQGVLDLPPRPPQPAQAHVLQGGPEPGSPWVETYRRAGRAGAPADSLTPALREQLQPKSAEGPSVPLHLRGVPGLAQRSLVGASTRVLALHNLASDAQIKDAALFDDILEDAVAHVEQLLKGWREERDGSGTEAGTDGDGDVAGAGAGEGEGRGADGSAGAELGKKRRRWEAGSGGGSAKIGAALVSWKAPRTTWARRFPPFAWDDAATHAWDERCRLGEPDTETMTVFGGKSVVQSVTGDRFLAAVDRKRGPRMQVAGMGSLFLELESVATAVRLQQELSGRAFGDRIVVTSFVPLEDYASDWFWGFGREYDASLAAKS